MIDNVILLLTGTLHERDTRELLDKCHPLGENIPMSLKLEYLRNFRAMTMKLVGHHPFV
jgi:vacuolar-type H+-ATPase subunit C/Vma6